MREPVKPGIACAYCKAVFSRSRSRRRRARRAMEQRARDSGLGVNHVEERAFNLVDGDRVEEESETSQGDQSIHKLEICQFCLFTKINCKCKAEVEEQKEVNSMDDNSRMTVDKPKRKRINLIKRRQVISSNVDIVEDEKVIEVCPQSQEVFWVASSKHPSISHQI